MHSLPATVQGGQPDPVPRGWAVPGTQKAVTTFSEEGMLEQDLGKESAMTVTII